MAAILSVFGRQWVAHFTRKPDDSTNQRNAMRQKQRKEFADKYLMPILDSLHPVLVVSIILFVAGLLYQLWNLSVFAARRLPLLIAASSIGSALVLAVLLIILFSFCHAVRHEESPFSTPFSKFSRKILPNNVAKPFPDVQSDHGRMEAQGYMINIVPLMTDDEHISAH